jgi:hypothetical protein
MSKSKAKKLPAGIKPVKNPKEKSIRFTAPRLDAWPVVPITQRAKLETFNE